MRRRLAVAKIRALRRIGRALSPYIWPPALIDRLAHLEELLECQGAGTPARRLDRLEDHAGIAGAVTALKAEQPRPRLCGGGRVPTPADTQTSGASGRVDVRSAFDERVEELGAPGPDVKHNANVRRHLRSVRDGDERV